MEERSWNEGQCKGADDTIEVASLEWKIVRDGVIELRSKQSLDDWVLGKRRKGQEEQDRIPVLEPEVNLSAPMPAHTQQNDEEDGSVAGPSKTGTWTVTAVELSELGRDVNKRQQIDSPADISGSHLSNLGLAPEKSNQQEDSSGSGVNIGMDIGGTIVSSQIATFCALNQKEDTGNNLTPEAKTGSLKLKETRLVKKWLQGKSGWMWVSPPQKKNHSKNNSSNESSFASSKSTIDGSRDVNRFADAESYQPGIPKVESLAKNSPPFLRRNERKVKRNYDIKLSSKYMSQPSNYGSEQQGNNCTKCGQTFQSLKNVRRHMLIHTETSRPFKCTLCPCGFYFLNQSSLRRHEIRFHIENNPNPSRVITSTNGAQSESIVKDTNFKCTLCYRVLKERKYLRTHIQRVHKIEEASQIGELMELSQVQSPSMGNGARASARAATPSTVYSSGRRSEVTSVNSRDMILIKNESANDVSIENKPKLRNCPECGAAVQSGNFSRHLKLHSKYSSRPWKCPECGCNFGSKGALTLHMLRSHELKEETAACASPSPGPSTRSIPKTSETKLGSQAASSSHSGSSRRGSELVDGTDGATVAPLYKFYCNICNAPFQRLEELSAHKMDHGTGMLTSGPLSSRREPDSSLQCKLCNCTFKTPITLQIHENTIHGDDDGRTIKCTYCICTFRTITGAKVHERSKHKINDKNGS